MRKRRRRGKGGRGTGLQQGRGRGGWEQKFRRVPSTGERVVKRGHVYPGLPLHESDQSRVTSLRERNVASQTLFQSDLANCHRELPIISLGADDNTVTTPMTLGPSLHRPGHASHLNHDSAHRRRVLQLTFCGRAVQGGAEARGDPDQGLVAPVQLCAIKRVSERAEFTPSAFKTFL